MSLSAAVPRHFGKQKAHSAEACNTSKDQARADKSREQVHGVPNIAAQYSRKDERSCAYLYLAEYGEGGLSSFEWKPCFLPAQNAAVYLVGLQAAG